MKIKINKEQIVYLNSLDTPEAKKEFLMNCFLHQFEDVLKNEYKEEVEDYPYDRLIAMGIAIASRREKPDIEYVDPIDEETLQKMNDLKEFGIIFPQKRNYTIGELVDKVTEMSVDKIEKENLLKFDLPKGNQNKIFKEQYPVSNRGEPLVDVTGKQVPLNHESLSKEQLKDITKPTVPKNFLDKWLDEGIHVTEYGVRPIHNFKLLEEFKNYEPPHPDKVKKYTKEDLEKAFNNARNINPLTGVMGDRYFKYALFEDYLKEIIPSS